MADITLPVELPISFTEETTSYTVKLPVTLPIEFSDNDTTPVVKLPVTLPITFSDGKTYAVKLPITLPMKFVKTGEKTKQLILLYKENVNLETYHGTSMIPYTETAVGKSVKIPYKEKAWFFPGLILQERILSETSAQLTLSENVQALIMVDFELVTSNTLKLTWYGSSVPSFTVMKKSAVDDEYTADKTVNWSASSTTVDIESEDYNIQLIGTANSGSSAVYTIAGVNDVLIQPTVEVLLNEKIYEATIEYTGTYNFEINY